MDKKVVWSDQSFKDIDFICEYISRDSRFYAFSFADKLFNSGESLNKYFHRGRIVPELLKENIREIFINDYRMIYRINDEYVEILTVIHGKRIVKKSLKKYK